MQNNNDYNFIKGNDFNNVKSKWISSIDYTPNANTNTKFTYR